MKKTSFLPQDGAYFLDSPSLHDSIGNSIYVKKVLFHTVSEYQDIYVVDACGLGRMLILDNEIQTCEFDESAYHEMIVHVPLRCHPKPERILVIGGGDGGVLRELAKYESIKIIDICEIDEEVIKASQKYLPNIAKGFSDQRVKVHIGDAAIFVSDSRREYDVIIVDSSDPAGPATVLYEPEFYDNLTKILHPDGIIVSQAESYYIYPDFISDLFGFLKDKFKHAYYYLTMVPTYTSGIIGFAFCSHSQSPYSFAKLTNSASLSNLKYYNPLIHKASFCLPSACYDVLPAETAILQKQMCEDDFNG